MVDKLFHQFPIYGYMKNQAIYEPTIEDEYTYDKIIEANAKYLQEQVEGENQAAQEKGEEPTDTQEESKDQPKEEQEETDRSQSQAVSGNEKSAPAVAEPQVEITREQLEDYDYLLGNFFIVDSTTAVDETRINAPGLLDMDMTLEKDPSVPQILIYHTHSQEGFADSRERVQEDTVVGVGDYLTELLQDQYGYGVIHDTGTYDVVDGVIDRNSAYDYSMAAVEQILAENPSVEVVIDLHRDGVAEGTHLVTDVGGKPTARIMYFNGLSRTRTNGDIDYLYNPYIQDNLAFSLQMQLAAMAKYPGFTRHIYLKGYRYNMHFKPKSLLIEAGAQTNTVDEMRNAVTYLADVLDTVLIK